MTMYTVLCDGCGKDVMEGAEVSAWGEVWMALEEAEQADWLDENGESFFGYGNRHYCRDCYFHDEEDNFHIRPSEGV
jgi:hypothetical protein